MESEEIIFKKFDVVSDPSDHYFVNHSTRKDHGGYLEATTITSIKREWDLLEQNLHETAYDFIFIRAYNYIDLMRAVIVGPNGTPYAHSLFFFDIWLPPDFPKDPPKLHYHSHGLDVNPNLDIRGEVSFRFINTRCSGNSEESTLLQVLKTIQDSVLCAQPYFHQDPCLRYEYGRQYGEWRSREYNNHVFKLCCNKMVDTLENPPKYFEEFVKGSFRMHVHSILRAIEFEYLKGNSDMKRMLKLLYDAFEANDIHDEHFSYLSNKENRKTKWMGGKGKNSVLWEIWRKWKLKME